MSLLCLLACLARSHPPAPGWPGYVVMRHKQQHGPMGPPSPAASQAAPAHHSPWVGVGGWGDPRESGLYKILHSLSPCLILFHASCCHARSVARHIRSVVITHHSRPSNVRCTFLPACPGFPALPRHLRCTPLHCLTLFSCTYARASRVSRLG